MDEFLASNYRSTFLYTKFSTTSMYYYSVSEFQAIMVIAQQELNGRIDDIPVPAPSRIAGILRSVLY